MTEPSGRVLLLRNNRLRGHIPQNLCSLSSIKILDLANTKLNRSIPSCLNNISFGRGSSHDNDGYSSSFGLGLDNELGVYSGSLDIQLEFDPAYDSNLKFIFEFASKSRYESYSERSLDFMFGMDLLNNELNGEITYELGNL
ncbi:BnaC01g27780D [Brassica napus]|uniref:BnaC01g27780D protein n=1 Tax=Brassica napus TaxID=3708 RepID=A0A078IBZ0_BRANA|nr:BnaC01g27780D [Brassica napus]